MKETQEKVVTTSSDALENGIRENMPRILEILLIDMTASTSKTPKNIIWANDNYIDYGSTTYAATAQIMPELITGVRGSLITPRALKTQALQRERTRKKTDVAFNNIERDFTLHLSGTPFKAVASGKFSDDQIFNWSYADEQDAKAVWSDVDQNNPYERLRA